MKKLFLSGIAAFLATGAALKSAQAGYFFSDKWIANCRYDIIEKRRPEGDEDDVPEGLMFIKPADLPNLEREIKETQEMYAVYEVP